MRSSITVAGCTFWPALPLAGIPGGDIPNEGALAFTGDSGFTYVIPEPTSFALLALGVVVLMRRRKRAA